MKIKNSLAINDNGFVFDPVTGQSYTLNPIGLEMLKYLHLGQSKDEIKKFYLENYEIDEWGFEKAFIDFVALLDKNHLISHD
ncbi:MAG: PqqD family protein [Bacteroidetes bacterium]|jgi:hypothetical protein|nr:PqqD family protein [Bacteroidota bacterium]MBT3751584.1 PqqD family protein [Bacteroidota bacterium]MBT4401820.1 PqqD family protein [Bacteroidota bacterium]MBT4410250.1 PqqD family protein [Bacteroidota bacterium]MBT5425426.1 PqqD family protein [Bacteroidota bacterium]